MKQKLPLLLVSCVGLSSCSRTPPATPISTNTAQAVVDVITGNARGSRNDARALRRQSDERLAAKNYKGAMDARLQMLLVRKSNKSLLGFLTAGAIQELALGDLVPIASQLDAASCRKYAQQLEKLDAGAPDYVAILQHEKASALKDFAGYAADPSDWQKTISGLKMRPQEHRELASTSIAQIKTNIAAIYDAAIRSSKRPYWSPSETVAVDPYTRKFASPSTLGRFVWTRLKTERLLVVEALENRAARLDKSTPSRATSPDPLGKGAFKQHNGVVYSVGADGKDDGGKFAPGTAFKRPDYRGDIAGPSF